MITIVEMKEDLYTWSSFLVEKNRQNHTIFEKMPPLTRLMKDIW